MHGSERAPEVARQLCVDLAERTCSIVVAPLFPVAITDDDEFHNYIFLRHGDLRYDLILLAMVDEVAARFAVPADRLWLAGFSGGGQFALRFMYLHAARLQAVSIGAPGIVNTLDNERDWPIGVRGMERIFGRTPQLNAMRKLAVQVVIGACDISSDIVIAPGDTLYAEGVNDSGVNRLERATFLSSLLRDAGIDVSFSVVPGAGHLASDVQPEVDAFFLRHA